MIIILIATLKILAILVSICALGFIAEKIINCIDNYINQSK